SVLLGTGYGISKAVKAPDAVATPPSKSADVPMVPGNFSELAETVRPGVVNIQVVKKVKNVAFGSRDLPGNPFGENSPFGDFFGPFSEGNPSTRPEQRGVGSGFVLSREGYIVTNNHVVEDADQIKVKLANGKEYDGKIVGRDPKTDLALVKIDGASDLHSLTLGNSDELKVGSLVVAVGSPFGLEQTVTAGIVSAKGRVIGSGPYDSFIQTDASTNPGNSGGPLINAVGEVVGVNSAIFSQTGGNVGIGFAIPIDLAKKIVEQLRKNGRVVRGWLGVRAQDVTVAMASSQGLARNPSEMAVVTEVAENSPAAEAGVKTGDIIVEFNGKAVPRSHDFPGVIADTPPGQKVTLGELQDESDPNQQAE